MDNKEKTIKSELIYKGKILSLYKDDVICPNGVNSIREVVRKNKGAAVIALVNNKIILEKQYRYPYDETILEIPAGKCEDNEDSKITASRELEEETGYKANKLTYLGCLYPSVAYTDEIIDLYYAEDLIKTKTHLDKDEQLDVVFITIDEFRKLILEGKIKDAKTIIAFFLFVEKIKGVKWRLIFY